MSRLPSRLQPLWPVAKRTHRLLTRLFGILFRLLSPVIGARGLPLTATTTSVETARREPDRVFVHPSGPAESLARGPAIGEPPHHWVFVRGESAKVPARYTLEVAGGRVSGAFGATITPGKVLDYQTSGYFGLADWREHPVFLRPTTGRCEHVPGTAVSLTTRGTSANYYHFLYDAVARWGILEESFSGLRPEAVIVPHQLRYQRQLLALAGIPGPYREPMPGRAFSAERLLVPSTPNQDLHAPRWVVDWLRARLPARPNQDTPRRLYLSRGRRRGSRRYVEEEALLELLAPLGFISLDPGTLTVQEQIDVFHGAEIVVAPHGAGLTNITFCSAGTTVVELFAPSYVHLGLWNIAEAIDGVQYRYLVGDGPTCEGRTMNGVLDDVSIPPERVLGLVEATLATDR